MAIAIQVENLSKTYRLGRVGRGRLWGDIRHWLRPATTPAPELFWALREVGFDVQQGEVVGVLGHNGAGKSTLLKILSQITAPSTGRVRLRGRVGSLLEVGTGFHPELTGRENVFLNGTILGMSRREIARRFPEIVEFSGVEQFIDTPVKRYSSGMTVRLAFAVAAHLEPEILIIDEVLAVGDAAFQQRCLGKIGEVSASGRTVLFVSHNTAAVQSLCKRGMVMDHGRLAFDGTQNEAIAHYASRRLTPGTALGDRTDREGSGEVRVTAIEIRNSEGEPAAAILSGEDVEVWLRFQRTPTGNHPRMIIRLVVLTAQGAPVFVQANWLAGDWFGDLPEQGSLVCRLPRLPLAEGEYRLDYRILTTLRGGDPLDSLENAARFTVGRGDFFGTGNSVPSGLGSTLVHGRWRVEA